MKKKLLALLGAVASLALFAGCGEKECTHTYDNACDTTCNDCGEERVTEHVYDNACDADCNVCGDTRTPAAHVYDNDCDDSCNVCGDTRTPEDHVYDNACDASCNVCGDTRTPADHVYDNACDASCNVCGDERTPEDHVYDNACDTSCNVCGDTREITHDFAAQKGFRPAMTIMGGGQFAIVATVENAGKAFAALGADKNYGYMPVADVAFAASGMFTTGADVVYTLEQCGMADYKIIAPDGRYVYMTGNYNSFNLSVEEPTEGHIWTVDTSTGAAKIINKTTNKWIQYDSQYGTYGAYDSDKGTLPSLYNYVGASYVTDETHHWTTCTVCGTASEKVAHSGGEASCTSQAICSDCGTAYGDLGDHTFEYEYWMNTDDEHWIQCDNCDAKKEGTIGSHSYTLIDSMDAKYDYAACVCGKKDESTAFAKRVDLLDQTLYLGDQDYVDDLPAAAISIAGIDEYVSITSIKVGDYDLGTDLNALVYPAELKADKTMHGKQNIVVTVVDAAGFSHEILVPVTMITMYITDVEDLESIQPSADNPAIYGYYVLTADIANNDLAKNAYCTWNETDGFFATFDGNGHSIALAANGGSGLFGILRGATIKNLTIKDNWASNYNYVFLIGKASFGSTFSNIEVKLVAGNGNPNVGSGSGWLFQAEFSNNTVKNFHVDLGAATVGNIFGCKFFYNTFDDVTVVGNYTEIGWAPAVVDEEGNEISAEASIKLEDVEAPMSWVEKVEFEEMQIIDLSDPNSKIDLGDYADAVLVSIVTAEGYEFNGLSAQYASAVLKNTLSAHGETTIYVTVDNGLFGLYEIAIPAKIVTRTIKTMQELDTYVKSPNGATAVIDGYYMLANDVAYTEYYDANGNVVSEGTEGAVKYTPQIANWGWSDGKGFIGTLDGNGKTITISSNALNMGLFGLVQAGAVIKNVKIVDAWNNSTPIFGRNAYGATLEKVEINIAGGYDGVAASDKAPLFGNTVQNITMKDVKITSSVAIAALFYNVSGGSYTNVTVTATTVGAYSNNGTTAVTDFPAGITVTQTAAQA